MKLYGHPDRHTAILTTHLSGLLSTWDSPPQWWFIRYQDPESHLRLRIRLRSADTFSQTAQRVGTWAGGLRRLGLIGQVQLDTYYPETGRFGGGAAMTNAESVFAADSAAAIAQLTYTGASGDAHRAATSQVIARVIREAVTSTDAYSASDVLSHQLCRSTMAQADEDALADIVELSGLKRATMPATLLDDLMTSAKTSEAQLAQLRHRTRM